MFGSNSEKKGMCGCCDDKDPNCRCMHHKLVGIIFCGVVTVIVLVFVFAAGIWVGKFCAYWHMYKEEVRRSMMYDRYQYQNQYPSAPMMNWGPNYPR